MLVALQSLSVLLLLPVAEAVAELVQLVVALLLLAAELEEPVHSLVLVVPVFRLI
jgi:hypothetical protein